MKNGKIIKKNYGSIPHLSTSKMSQQADKKIGLGQEGYLTKKARDWKDLVIVTEKVDGSNVGVVNKNGELHPITRAGYNVGSSPHKQHHLFTDFMDDNITMFEWLPEGWRVCGEWCVMAHGTIYNISKESPFVAFDIIDDNNHRVNFFTFLGLCIKHNIPMVTVLHVGQPISIKNAIKLLGKGNYGNPEKPEGVVYRMEREGKVDYLAKWVRSDKEDGKYLDSILWNTKE